MSILGRVPRLSRNHCIDCGVTLGRTRISSRCNSCLLIATPHTPIPKPLEHICKVCDRPFKIVRSKDMCHPCYGAEQDRQKEETLKVYELHISKNPLKRAVLHWDQTIVMLSTDRDSAITDAFIKIGYDWQKNVDRWSWTVHYVEGPFNSGFILSDSGVTNVR